MMECRKQLKTYSGERIETRDDEILSEKARVKYVSSEWFFIKKKHFRTYVFYMRTLYKV